MQKEPEKRINVRQLKHDLYTAYRRMTWKIWVYLKSNPDILAANNNQKVFDEVARIQTEIYLRRNPDQTRDEAFSTQDFISDLEAKYNEENYYFEQELMDLFRPSSERNEEWKSRMFLELLFFSGMPESYTKSEYQKMFLEDEQKQSIAQNKSDMAERGET